MYKLLLRPIQQTNKSLDSYSVLFSSNTREKSLEIDKKKKKIKDKCEFSSFFRDNIKITTRTLLTRNFRY